MPDCPKCKAEVDVGQKMCAWCGEELTWQGAVVRLKSTGSSPPSAPQPVRKDSSSGQIQQPIHSGPSVQDARELAQRGDLEGASHLFRLIIDKDPENPEALFGLGGIHFKRGEFRKAHDTWLKLKKVRSDYPNLDSWIQQAQQKLTPSSPVVSPVTSPPPIQQHRNPTPPPSSHPISSKHPSSPLEAFTEKSLPKSGIPLVSKDDWQYQTVRVDHIEEKLQSQPNFKKKTEPTKKEIILDIPAVNSPGPLWGLLAGWFLTLFYLGLLGVLIVLF